MSVVCEQPNIAEKLVPYVEGALAEPDRSEVLEHLRGCESCANEVRVIKSSIVTLRHVFTRTSQYRPLTHVSAEDLERFAFEPETLTAEVMRSVKLHLAECGECEQEVALLREMEQELAEKVEPVRAPEALPAALREAVVRQFGTVKTVTGQREERRPWLESFLAFFATLSPKPLLAAGGAMVVLFVGMQFVQHLPESAPPSAVSTATTRQVASNAKEVAATPAAPGAAAFGNSREVALLPGRVDSGELPGFSRKLWEAKVSHSYRDGQIFVAAEDVDKARQALEIVPREVAAVDLDLAAKQKKAAAAADKAEVDAGATPASPEAPTVADAKVASYGVGSSKADAPREVASAEPARPKPEEEAPRPAARPAEDSRARKTAETTAKAAPRPAAVTPARPVAAAAPPKTAVAPARPASAPAQPPAGAVAPSKKGPASGTETVAILTPKTEKGANLANPRQQVAQLPVQQQVAVAPNAAVLRGGADDPVAPIPVRSGADEQPKASERPADAEGSAAAPPPPPPAEGRRESKDGLAARTNGVPVTNVGGGMNAPATTMQQSGAGRQAPANRLDDVAMAESALLTQARKVASEAVGDSTVSIDKRDDGSVVVTVRSGRPLTSQEMDQLRKALRQKLSLADSDTVVIRQP